MRLGTALVAMVVCCSGVLGAVAASDSEAEAGGRLAWVLSDDLELIGDLWVDLPLRIGARDELLFSLDTRTNISRTTGEFAFEVQDLEYDLAAGWRFDRTWLGSLTGTVQAIQRGKERVDANGQPYVRYLGLGLASRGGQRVDWSFVAGPVLDEREVDADLALRGESSIRLGELPWLRSAVVFDLTVDGIVDGSTLRADVTVGPRWILPLGDERAVSFYLHYQDSRNPLGIGPDVWLFGFQYDKREFQPATRSGTTGADVDGLVAAGGGDGRYSGQLLIRTSSPKFGPDLQAVLLVDANALTADDTGDLFYFYHAGIERDLGQHRAGVYFYHRSNHQLAEPNATITSLNVVEFGFEKEGRLLPGKREGFTGWARVGYLINSSFGEDRRWHVRGGARHDFRGEGPGPGFFVTAEAEAGDIERETFGVGLTVSADLEFQLEYRSDPQYFARDSTATLLTARYGF